MTEKNELKIVASKMKELYDSLIEAGFEKQIAIEYLAALACQVFLGKKKQQAQSISMADLLG